MNPARSPMDPITYNVIYRRKGPNAITMEGTEHNKNNHMTAVIHGQWLISADGKTLTYTVQIQPSSGKQFNGTTVFIKQ